MSSTGLPPRTAAALAYSGWWITGVLFWFLERRDPYVRFHAAQAISAFGVIAALILLLGVLAAAALSFLPFAYMTFVAAAAAVWIAGVVLWGVTLWKIATGGDWRIPLAAGLAERLNERT